ncbi:MAG: excinuclease ABC subunit UvrC [Firmicutes bacterium]|nr:excinuclease ABC subunit UvrC [Bacillota bacterium]
MIKEKLSLVPNNPGCYLMKNNDNVIIYVGKAKKLKNRLNSYFHGTHYGKTKKLVSEIVDFEYIVVNSETESLILEQNLIKKYNPKYNILLRDDKSYPYIEFTDEKIPRLLVVRNVNRKKTNKNRLFGPYPNVTAARSTVNLLNRMYPLRKCTSFNSKPCLYYHINQCLGYCTNSVNEDSIKQMEEEIIKFLKGDHSLISDKIKEEMIRESELLNYEKAKELKELYDYITITLAKQKVEIEDTIDRDVFGYFEDKDMLSIQVLFIRGGKIIGRHSNIFPIIDDIENELNRYIISFYEKDIIKPKEILIPSNLNEQLLESVLEVKVKSPQKGLKLKIVEMANDNAKISLGNEFELIKRDEQKTAGANEALAELLNIKTLDRIEIFDNSNLFGNFNVSGMVVFCNGKPNKNEYRKFKITRDSNDDYGTMREVIYRRYFRVLKDNLTKPNLIIVDGGLGQVNVAKEVLTSLGLNIPIIGLKKDNKHRTDTIIALNPLREIKIDHSSDVFFYLERMQDEVHNFTINYHKQLRSKGALESVLLNIEGIGDKRLHELLKKYKTLNNLKKASIEDLSSILSRKVAINLKDFLHHY